MYDIVRYEEARSVEEAVALLQAYPKARPIAGGSDLLIKIRHGELPEAELVSLRAIPALGDIALDGDAVAIGAGATFSQVARHPLVRERLPLLCEAVAMVGGPQIRNIGTIGGNVCNGATSADSAPALFALNAKLRLEGPSGSRTTAIGDFYKGPGKVDLRPAEVLTAIVVAAEDCRGFGGCYIKFAMRKAMDIATVSCAALCRMEAGVIADCRLALGVAAPTPVRCRAAEAAITGKPFSEKAAAEFGKAAAAEVNPRTSWRATRDYRLQLVEELSRRALGQAFARAGGRLPSC